MDYRNLRRLATTAAAGVIVAGCAAPPGPSAIDAAAPPALAEVGAPADLDAMRLARRDRPKRKPGPRDRAASPSVKYHLELEADEHGPPTTAQVLRAQEQRHALVRPLETQPKSAGLQPATWQSLGPANVGGRVRAIAFDPRNAERLLAGTASGGLWISTNFATTWRAHSDFLPNLSITTLAFDPTETSVVYLGTGEATAGLVGIGAFKSTDGGETWRHLPATNPDGNADWRFVNRLAVHPRTPGVVLAALTNNNFTSGAIYRSVDGGTSWAKVSAFRALDIAFDPNTPANAVAGLDDGTIAYSRDAGLTWTKTARLVATPSGRGNTARAEIAFARSRPGVVYASVDNDKGEVWRSDNAGANWYKLANPGHLNLQGDYDNAIWVDPTDSDHVIVGGLDIYQSRDGGTTFVQVSDWSNAPRSPHADHHALVSPPDYGPGRRRLLNGNDGGVYRALDTLLLNVDAWSSGNAGLAVTQFYSGAGNAGRVIGGTQDNGSLQLVNGLWRPFRGGDGGYVALDPTDPDTFYGSYVYLAIHRVLDGGPARYICEGIAEAMPDEPENDNEFCGATTRKANFIAPFIIDPNNPNRLLGGAHSLWVTDNARGAPPAWRAIKAPPAGSDNYINAIAVREGDSAAIWVGHNAGEVFRTANGLAVSPAWTRVGQGVLPSRRVMHVTLYRDEPNRVIVAFTGFTAHNVWQSRDNGATWSSITGNLPAVPVFDVKRHPTRREWLYAATSVGVFTSENGGATWSTTNEGPANIRVRELFWIDDHTLGAATYGRGMFKASVPGDGPANYQDLWWAGSAENGWGMSITQHGAMIFAAMYIYDEQGRPQWVVMPGGTWSAGFGAFTGALYIPTGSWFGAYDASRMVAGAPVGNATLAFTSASTATLAYTINGVAGTKSIMRQPFGPMDATPVASYGD
ncbi:MAG TPA: hypothetical protein VFD95_11975, partial [Usitatibacter sp.]|nr:hypothetical protein [Usitatibacter sp.]